MKNVMTFFILLLVCSMAAQNVEWTQTQETPREQIDHVLENLDFTEITSGYLMEHTVPLYPLNRFDGHEKGDSIRVSIVDLNLMYVMMEDAAIDTSTLPPYANIENAATGLTVEDTIPIVIFQHRYERIKPDAVANNLLTIVNEQLYDVPGRPASPYLEDTLFVATTMAPASNRLDLAFTLDTPFIVNNLDSALTEVLIDFDDGNGFQTVTLGDVIEVSYDEFTDRKIIIKTIGPNPRSSESLITLLEEPILPESYQELPDETIPINVEGTAGAMINVFHASCPGQLGGIRKPFIYIQGFNASKGVFNLDFPELFLKKFNQEFSFDGTTNTRLTDELSNAGYDLIYIDFNDASDDFKNSAEIVKAVIEHVNAEKAANGSTAKNIVMGSSGGGMIGLFALRSMEVAGEDHEVGTYFTYDAQLRGANIALGAQGFLKHIANVKLGGFLELKDIDIPNITFEDFELPIGVLSGFIPNSVPVPNVSFNENPLKTFENALKSTGAQQFVVMNIFDPTFENGNGSGVHGQAHVDFMTSLDAMGKLEVEHIVLGNGSQIGEGQLANPGDKFFSVDFNMVTLLSYLINEITGSNIPNIPVLNFLFGEGINYEAETYMVADYSSSWQTVFKGALVYKISLFIELRDFENNNLRIFLVLFPFLFVNFFDHSSAMLKKIASIKEKITAPNLRSLLIAKSLKQKGELKVKGKPAYDTSPGGFVGPEKNMADDLSPMMEFDNYFFSIAPTVSVLGIDTYDFFIDVSDPETVTNSGVTHIDDYAASDRESFQLGLVQHNQDHGSMNDKFGILLQNKLVPIDALATIPLPPPPATIRTIDNQTFNIGTTQIIEDIQDNLGVSVPPSFFINSDLDIINSGKLLVNGNDLLFFTNAVPANPANSTNSVIDLFLTPKDECSNGSLILWVATNGEMRIGEWTDAENTANTFVEDNATILIGGSGTVSVENNSSLVVNEGGNIVVRPSGLLKSRFGANITIQNGGTVRVQSGGMLRIQHYSELHIEDGGKLIFEDGAKVQLWDGSGTDGAATIHVKGGGELVIEDEIDFSGSGFFQFDEDNILTINSDHFELEGEGQGTRFIRVNENATLNIGDKKIILKDGKVTYENGSKINLDENGAASFFRTDFTALNAHSGEGLIAASSPKRIFIENCLFERLERAVVADGIKGELSLYLNMIDSEIRYCEQGIVVSNTPSISLKNTDFIDLPLTPGLVGLNLNTIENAYVSSCHLTNYSSQSGAVHLFDVADYTMRNGLIDNCQVGINATTGHNNIDMVNGATIADNEFGILIEGGFPFGVVTMDCANLLRNQTGIKGTDVLLNIDASGAVNTNQFETTSGSSTMLLFDICYDALGGTVGSSIDAKNNYWVNTILYRLKNLTTSGGTCGTTTNNMTIITNPQAFAPPTGCGTIGNEPNEPTDPTSDFTGDDPNCEMSPQQILYDQYFDAYTAYLIETHDEAAERISSNPLYASIANLSEAAQSAYTDKCRQLVHIAKSKVGQGVAANSGSNTTQNIFSKKDIKPTAGVLQTFPNPAKNEFLLVLETGKYTLEIFDFQGQRIYQNQLFSSEKIFTNNWNTGIYFVKVQNMETNEVLNGKVNIHK